MPKICNKNCERRKSTVVLYPCYYSTDTVWICAADTDGQYYEDIKDKVESWFDKVKDMAKAEDIADVKTEIFIDVKSVIESVIDYASRRNIDLIVIGTRGRFMKKILDGKRSKWRCTACSLSCLTCQIATDVYVLLRQTNQNLSPIL